MTVRGSAMTTVTGRAVVLRGADIDTDRIMPARYLKAVTFSGLEHHLFADDRAAARGGHPLDAPAAAGAAVLLTGANFGCGSSREHAPQALQRWGIRAVIAESFSPIFAGNALSIGLVCAAASTDALHTLMDACDRDPATTLRVDVTARTVAIRGQAPWPLELPDSHHHALISGEWDATGLLLADYEEVERVDARLPYLRATARNA